MQKLLLFRISILLCLVMLQVPAFSQCTINCPENIKATATSSQGAVVNYTTPAIPNGCGGVQTQSQTFNFTGAAQTFTVPAGVSTVTIKAWGAEGGGTKTCLTGGLGGYATGTLSVSEGSILYVYVGEKPGVAPLTSDAYYPGGFNGGGRSTFLGGGGGGASDVRAGESSLSNRVIVAGGGGGVSQSYDCFAGGAGGGLSGTDGVDSNPQFPGGGGGTQSGAGAAGLEGEAGSLGQGGNAVDGAGSFYQAGGGGGYYGGGSAHLSGAGGGSGYVGGVTDGSMQTGINSGHGKVEISYQVATTPTLTQTAGKASGSTFPVGVTTNTFELNDGAGNITSCSFTVTVIDVRCGPKNDKVLVCHKDAKGKRSTLCVSKGDVASHLAHGDYLGSCGRTSEAYEVVQQEIGVEQNSLLTIQVLGNPATNYFQLVPQGGSPENLHIRVLNAAGQVVESKVNVPVQGILELGQRYPTGMYFMEVVQGNQRLMLKLVKSPR